MMTANNTQIGRLVISETRTYTKFQKKLHTCFFYIFSVNVNVFWLKSHMSITWLLEYSVQ